MQARLLPCHVVRLRRQLGVHAAFSVRLFNKGGRDEWQSALCNCNANAASWMHAGGAGDSARRCGISAGDRVHCAVSRVLQDRNVPRVSRWAGSYFVVLASGRSQGNCRNGLEAAVHWRRAGVERLSPPTHCRRRTSGIRLGVGKRRRQPAKLAPTQFARQHVRNVYAHALGDRKLHCRHRLPGKR